MSVATSGEILRVVVEYDIPNSSEALNIFWYVISDGEPSDSDVLDDFLSWVDDVWHDLWATIAFVNCSIIGLSIDVINPDGTVDRNIGTTSVSLAGTVTGDGMPGTVAGYLLAYTANPKQRGSKYVPGIAESVIDQGLFDSAGVTVLLLLLAAYLARVVGDVSSASYDPGVLSRTLAEFVVFNDSGTITDVPAIQRRRKPNVGS